MMRAGKATAVMNETVIDFRLDTPSAEVIDLGTSFGVEVFVAGGSEVHVLEGEVLAGPIAAGKREFVRLQRDMAVRVEPEQTDLTRIAVSRDRFTENVRPELVPKLTYVYSHSDDYSAIYINGELQGASNAPFDISLNSRKVSEKHGKSNHRSFTGDVAEAVIFNGRLSEEEVSSVNGMLIDKYGL